MTIRKTACGLVSAAALMGVFAGSASAQDPGVFEAHSHKSGVTISESEPGKITGVNVGPQEFNMGDFHFTCEKASATKTKIASEESNTFYAQVHFKLCTTYFKVAGGNPLGPYKVKLQAMDFEYHWNGYAEIGAESESEVRLLNPGEVYAKVGSTQCEIYWEPQTIPAKAVKDPEGEYSAATYSTEEVLATGNELKLFPGEFKKTLVISNELKKVFTYAEGGKCENFKKEEFKNGFYIGTMQYKLSKGDLSFNSEEA